MSKVYLDTGGLDFRYFRVGGPGIGNILWLWVQALHVRHLTGIDIVWPTWNQVKPKALMRGEYSMGVYLSPFSKPIHEYYVQNPWKKKKSLQIPKSLLSSNKSGELKQYIDNNRNEFDFYISNLDEPFIMDCSNFAHALKSDWKLMTSNYDVKNVRDENYLSVHIRRGDFVKISHAVDLKKYESELQKIINCKKPDKVIIYTDAVNKDYEFWNWVKSDYIVRANENPIKDLIQTIDSRFFVGTYSSSFSRFVGMMRENYTKLL